MTSEMVVRFARALEVTTDELLGLQAAAGKNGRINGGKKPSLKVLPRLNRIETLPASQQKTLLKMIDTSLKAAEK